MWQLRWSIGGRYTFAAMAACIEDLENIHWQQGNIYILSAAFGGRSRRLEAEQPSGTATMAANGCLQHVP